MATVADVVACLNRLAPVTLAAEWDNVGLLLGDAAGPADRILTCLTLTPEVVSEALAEAAQMIVTHHPVMFRGVKSLSSTTSEGRLLLPLARAGIAVYSPHTAYDNCTEGINARLAEALELSQVRFLRPRQSRTCKLAVFVPESDLAAVSDAMFAAGAGCIGQYEQCSFRTAGIGTFYGTEGTNPTIGQVGRREQVPELRLEVIVPEVKLAAVIAAMRKAHSYEEPAFDVYPLTEPKFPMTGEGRIGDRTPIPLADFAKMVKHRLNAVQVQVGGDPTRMVRRVAVACGAAGEFLQDAIREQADAFVTGELRFHDALAAAAAGVAVVIPGHYATERPAVEQLAHLIQAAVGGTVWPSQRERDPLGWVV